MAMGECLQACMMKTTRCSVLMCGRSQMSARPDMQAYPSLRPLARCLIILAGTLTEKPAAGGGR